MDVTINLENEGFSCEGPDAGAEGTIVYECRFAEPDGSAEYQTSVRGYSPTEISSIDSTAFVYTGDPGAVAARFLGFIASVPYEDADPEAAQQWVRENIDVDAERDFGSAHYEIFGPERARILVITPTSCPDWPGCP